MHRVLQISEIVHLIAEILISDVGHTLPELLEFNITPWTPSRTARTSCARMARTCRVWYAPAMDALWKRMPSVEAMVHGLAFGEIDSNVEQTGAPSVRTA